MAWTRTATRFSYIDVDDIEVSLKRPKDVGAEVVMDGKGVAEAY